MIVSRYTCQLWCHPPKKPCKVAWISKIPKNGVFFIFQEAWPVLTASFYLLKKSASTPLFFTFCPNLFVSIIRSSPFTPFEAYSYVLFESFLLLPVSILAKSQIHHPTLVGFYISTIVFNTALCKVLPMIRKRRQKSTLHVTYIAFVI